VASGGGVNSILWFWLERESDRMKYCQKMSGGSELILAL
jgi:hypothetical protein